MDTQTIEVKHPAIDRLRERPELPSTCIDTLAEAAEAIIASLTAEGTLFISGNGGSMADALHIAGELAKSFEKARPLPVELQQRLRAIEGGDELADHLEAGLRVQVIGADPVLSTAVDNDIAMRYLGFAQHLVAMGRPNDVLLAISTSGRSLNVTNAARVAKAMGMGVIVLTGNGDETDLMQLGDIVIRTPATETAEVQAHHGVLYHALCRAIEESFFEM